MRRRQQKALMEKQTRRRQADLERAVRHIIACGAAYYDSIYENVPIKRVNGSAPVVAWSESRLTSLAQRSPHPDSEVGPTSAGPHPSDPYANRPGPARPGPGWKPAQCPGPARPRPPHGNMFLFDVIGAEAHAQNIPTPSP